MMMMTTTTPTMQSWKTSDTVNIRRLPQNNDKTVEDVEPVLHIAEQTFGKDFHQHLYGEQAAEEQVAVFQHKCVRSRLQYNRLCPVVHL